MSHGPKNDYNTNNVLCGADFPDFWQYKFTAMSSLWNFGLTLSKAVNDNMYGLMILLRY
jgi:hypothetical protein